MKIPAGDQRQNSWSPILFLTLACVVASAFSRVAAATPQTVFVPVTPCRIIDTRLGSSPGKLTPATLYTYKVALANYSAQGGNAAGCGIPLTVSGNNSVLAVALNVIAVAPTGDGDLRMWPADAALPTASIVNYAAVSGLNLANGIVVGICQTGCTPADVKVQADVHGAYLVADITGYFVAGSTALTLPFNGTGSDSNATFQATNTGTGNGVVGVTSSGASGVYGGSPSGAGYGVAGRAGGGSGIVAPTHTGTFGDSDIGYGVLGQSNTSDGVHGVSNSLSGVYGRSAYGAGVWGDSGGFDGVHGHTTVGSASGVAGFNDANGAGVFGASSTGNGVFGTSAGAGVWGESTGFDGVHGHTNDPNNRSSGVAGFGGGNNTGVFGYSDFGTGVHGIANGSGGVGDASGVLGEADLDGVHGHTHNPNGTYSGVAGIGDGSNNGVFGASTSGFGVNGHSDTGYGMATDGPVSQARNQGGWVKAMALIDDGPGVILRCFNSQLPAPQASTPPCGFRVSISPGATGSGPWVGGFPWIADIDMGFEVDDRFIVVTPIQLSGGTPTTAQVFNMSGNVVSVSTWDSSGNGVSAQFFIVVY